MSSHLILLCLLLLKLEALRLIAVPVPCRCQRHISHAKLHLLNLRKESNTKRHQISELREHCVRSEAFRT